MTKAITPGKLASLRKKPGMHRIDRGLYLRVRGAGAWWAFRYMRNGRAVELGLGSLDTIDQAKAIKYATRIRLELMDGNDPKAEAAKRNGSGSTFEAIAKDLIKAKAAGWRNAKHAAQWTSTLDTYAMPKLGKLDVAKIETEHVLAALRPIWTSKHETATRLRQRIEAVLSAASARGLRSGDNPARWRGHLDHLLAAIPKAQRVKHHPALPWRELPAFTLKLRAQGGAAALALELLILTASRANEIAHAQISEFDMQESVWIVPAARMKAQREHRIPLTPRALEIVQQAMQERTVGYLFPGLKPDKPITTAALSRVLTRMKRDTITVHGFRSTFRDWVGEATAHSGEVAEQALAHRITNQVEAAYRRGDMLDRRRVLMTDWENFAEGQPATVTPIRRAQR
ncbi:MAG: tyrosine-type recombinase/integrase [Pseudomonadota bacterium]|nr:tyrosine-type recombinase/integrase [Pseudomonadota bacterium]